jgi:hypothetical protein
LVFNEGPTKEQAKAAAEEVRKDALANVSNWCHMQSNKKVKSILMADTLTRKWQVNRQQKSSQRKRGSPWWS